MDANTLPITKQRHVPAALLPDIKPLLRKSAVMAATGYSLATLHRRITAGLFTKPICTGRDKNGAVCQGAWPADELAEINKARIAGKTDDEIRALVVKLEAARKEG